MNLATARDTVAPGEVLRRALREVDDRLRGVRARRCRGCALADIQRGESIVTFGPRGATPTSGSSLVSANEEGTMA